MMTQDKKCGAYTLVWISFLYKIIVTSLSSSASTIGSMNMNKMSYAPSSSVFFRMRRKSY